MDIVVKGNSKMGKDVFIFNLPAKKTCTPTDWCLHGSNGKPRCYALRNNYTFGNVQKSLEERYELSKQEDFPEKVIEFLHKKKAKYFRIHSSGDFYSEEYVSKWIEIAKNCPDTKFRSTTHRKDLASKIEELNSLPNVIIRESLETSSPNPSMNLPFAALSSLDVVKNNESYHCPNMCEPCGYTCWEKPVNMDFDEH
ncbi:hypothetical protein GW932_05130 [archaeon]|nr:hypothetical protein [archaeon]